MTWIILILLSYLVGSISFSYLLTRILKNEDIRNHGSGNAGATNTLRVLGKGPAAAVLILDSLKGVFVVLILFWLGYSSTIAMLGGLAAVLGHNYPIFFGFRGGKGVATTIGVFAAVSFLPSLSAGVIAVAAIWITGYVSLGSIIFLVLTPVFMMFKSGLPLYTIFAAACLSFLSIWRHRENIYRIIKGTERKIK
jgi:acyl phosphate:glycerol-3-phosphate acyltransferase